MRLVIIESPYSGDVERNERYLQACIRDCIDRGESPYASHRMLTSALDDTVKKERDQGIQAGFAWRTCAGVSAFYVDLGMSGGMIYGLKDALNLVEDRSLFHEIEVRRLGDDWDNEKSSPADSRAPIIVEAEALGYELMPEQTARDRCPPGTDVSGAYARVGRVESDLAASHRCRAGAYMFAAYGVDRGIFVRKAKPDPVCQCRSVACDPCPLHDPPDGYEFVPFDADLLIKPDWLFRDTDGSTKLTAVVSGVFMRVFHRNGDDYGPGDGKPGQWYYRPIKKDAP